MGKIISLLTLLIVFFTAPLSAQSVPGYTPPTNQHPQGTMPHVYRNTTSQPKVQNPALQRSQVNHKAPVVPSGTPANVPHQK